MARQRDYKAEYERRIGSAVKRGLSRSQARGHARSGEAMPRPKTTGNDDRLEAALRALRTTGNQGRAAKEAGVSPERFRRFLRENMLAERRGKVWHLTDNRPRRMQVISAGEAHKIMLRDFDQSSLNAKHQSAFGEFLRSNNVDLLRQFDGQSVTDLKGKPYLLETDPNALYRLAAQGSEVFHEINQLIHNGA